MIELKNINKYYTSFNGPLTRILAALSFGLAGSKRGKKALENINLTAKQGEVIGIIGRNGAGKSTLLKVLSGVSLFQQGEMKLNGNVRSILELGVGFNPELSGAENVYYNGLVWGYTPGEIKSLENEIFAFAGLEEYKNVLLKTYSSGMIMRLGFSLATAKNTSILLVDEALAVGDAGFQQKCINKFRAFSKEGSVILIVSHDLALLKTICNRIVVMDAGKIVYDGNPISAYEKYMELIALNSFQAQNPAKNELLDFFSLQLVYNDYINPQCLPVGANIRLEIRIKFNITIPALTIGFHIDDARGNRVFGTNSYHLKKEITSVPAGTLLHCTYQFPLNLAQGKYSLGVSLHESDSHATNCYLWKDNYLSFEIENSNFPKFEGAAYLPVQLTIHSDS